MIKKKSVSSAFTLIELLVVITIIGILAGIALPVFNSVQVKGSQTKALAQAKQIGLALKLFAGDNDGVYPCKGSPALLAADPTTANAAFATLFPQYLQNEIIFANKLVHGSVTPDNHIDNPYNGTNVNTLAKGENVYGYMLGLNDSSNPSCPLVFDGCSAAETYTNAAGSPGAVWSGTKAVVIRLDNSGAVESLDTTSVTAAFVKGNDSTGAVVNALDPAKAAFGMNSTANKALQPDL